MPRMWGTQENWLQKFPLRPCLSFLIPIRTWARLSSPTHGTLGMGTETSSNKAFRNIWLVPVFHPSFYCCRQVIQGTEPVVRYHYSTSGNYTLRLKLGVNVTEFAPLRNEVYSINLKVLGLYPGWVRNNVSTVYGRFSISNCSFNYEESYSLSVIEVSLRKSFVYGSCEIMLSECSVLKSEVNL